jgi:5-methylcytosine-specific restriction protein A
MGIVRGSVATFYWAKPKIWQRIEKLMNARNQILCVNPEELEREVDKLLKSKAPLVRPGGNRKPKRKKVEAYDWERSPEVKAWVLKEAGGKCELCVKKAPFRTKTKLYLEVHHIRPLGKGGSDTTDNAVALCPNCHKALHFAKDKEKLKGKVKDKVARIR